MPYDHIFRPFFFHIRSHYKSIVLLKSLEINTYNAHNVFNAYMHFFCPERDSNRGWCRMAVFEDCQATTLTNQPVRLVKKISTV